MLRWNEFALARPDLAEAGLALLYQHGVGLAFLSTVRRDGGPRLHPFCPVLTDDGLYGLLIPSPKLDDLRRDGRFAMHSYPKPENEDAFYLTGRAVIPDDQRLRDEVERRFREERREQGADAWNLSNQAVVEFLVSSCLLTRTTGHGDPAPRHTIWRFNQQQPRRVE